LHDEAYWAAFNSSPADFSGFNITHIDMYVNAATFTSPGSNPNGDGNWTSFTIDRLLNIYGTPVPEPTSMAIFVPAIGLLARRKR
jgi:hypothetical protein